MQADDSLRSAITVLAPDLTPLTDLAEDLADAFGRMRISLAKAMSMLEGE